MVSISKSDLNAIMNEPNSDFESAGYLSPETRKVLNPGCSVPGREGGGGDMPPHPFPEILVPKQKLISKWAAFYHCVKGDQSGR